MSQQVQWRRGSAAWHATFTGAPGEITVNTTDKTLHVHDGVTAGGHKLLNAATVGSVLYSGAQALSAPQKAQARANIGADTARNAAIGVYTTNENLTGSIPLDNSTPQSSEGTQIISVPLAASSADAWVEATFVAFGVHATTDAAIVAALFVDSETAARDAVAISVIAQDRLTLVTLSYVWQPGDTASHTYKIRVGPSGSGSIRLNGTSAGKLLLAAAAAKLIVREI